MVMSDPFRLAKQRGKGLQTSVPKAVAAHYDRSTGRIVIRLSSRLEVSFSAHDAQGLEHARPSQLEAHRNQPVGLRHSLP